MTLHLHRAPRADLLADALGDLLADPLEDPFATEVVVVPARGVERWLSQRLSHRLGRGAGRGDGVCAGVDFRTPGSLVAEITGTRDEDPWAPDSLVWPLLAALDDSLDETWAHTLAVHVGHGLEGEEADLRRGRRFAVARRLARLFAAYAVQRPGLVGDWSAGRDTDGCGAPIAPDLAWQPELWRRLAARVDAPPPHLRHSETVARLRDAPETFDLPDRLSLFGHTRLPLTEVALLSALGEHREVHLWLPHPSSELWAALADEAAAGPVARELDESHHRVGHPLLSTLGRDVRELQRTLATVDLIDEPVDRSIAAPDTLLGWLQDDLRGNAVGDPSGRVLAPGDRSVQVHACHGAARQVDVLREVLLGLLADDPTLEPRDVLVMCPDIETYAPLISAGFGLGDVVGAQGHPAHRLRVRLADRALTQTNPLLGVAARLLDLAGGRAGAGEVLDLAHADPVRRRFGFRDDDLQQLTDWVRQAGVRWAFDAEHRAEFGLQDYVSNTWQFGIDRLLAGVAMSEDAGAWLDRTLPLDDVGSGQIDLAGRLAEYVERLRDVTDRLVGAHPLEHWLDVLGDGIAALTSVPATDGWQAGQVQRELGRVREAAADLGTTTLRLPDVRSLLTDRLAGRPTRANFRTGTLTVCTMVPMRSVPHRVVCLLGLDDGVFPRVGAVDGDDVLARDPQTGERDPRSEDRQLMLDAVLAATETPGDHLHRRQRVLRAAPPAGGAPRRAARHPRPHRHRGRAGLHRGDRPPPVAALRRSQRHARRAGARPVLHLRPGSARRRGRRGRPADPARAVPRRPPGPARRGRRAARRRVARGPRRVLPQPRPRLPPAPPRHRAQPGRRPRGERAARRDRRADPVVGGRSGAARPAPRRGPRPRPPAGVATRRPATRLAGLADPPGRRGQGRAPGPRGAAAAHRRGAGGRRRRRPGRRSSAAGHRPGGVRRPAGAGELLPARRDPPAPVLAAAAGPDGHRRGPQLDGPHPRSPRQQPVA